MKWLYQAASVVARIFITPFYPVRYEGREHIPEGPAIICANHSSLLDPIFIAFALTLRRQTRFMAKAELFSIPVLGPIIRGVGSYPVKRGTSDVNAIRLSMQYLKQGEKILMFPEGTRVAEDEAADVKTGAIRLAMKLNVPILPVYIPRKKRIFRRDTVKIGSPFYVESHSNNKEEFQLLSDNLLSRIQELGATN